MIEHFKHVVLFFVLILYRLDRWFSRLDDFTQVILGPL